MTSSICEPLGIVTSHWSIILTLYLWTLSSSQWRYQPGRFSMAAHRHDRRGIYRCVLLRFRGRIEIDHLYGLPCRGLCCHPRRSARGDAFIITMALSARAFQHGGSSSWSSRDLSLCIASFSWENRNWPLIRSALSWFVLPLPAQHSCCAGSGSTNHSSADRIVVNSYDILRC